MNPAYYKRMYNYPRKRLGDAYNRKELDKELPEWDNLQYDHTKYRLTASEVEQRKQARKPRPRAQEPILGDKYLQESHQNALTDGEKDRIVDGIVDRVRGKVYEPEGRRKREIKRNTSYENVENSATIQKHSPQYEEFKVPPAESLSAKQTELISELVKAELDGFRQTYDNQFNEIFLYQINRLNTESGELKAQHIEQARLVEYLQNYCADQQRRIASLEAQLKVYEQGQRGAEYQEMEDILDRLKFM